MKNVLIVSMLLGTVSLGGCAGVKAVTGFAVSQGQVDTARTTYDGVLATASAYRKLGYCATGTVATAAKLCADRTIVAQLQADNAVIITQFNTLQTAVANGDDAGALAAYSTVTGLISTVKQIVANLGVK